MAVAAIKQADAERERCARIAEEECGTAEPIEEMLAFLSQLDPHCQPRAGIELQYLLPRWKRKSLAPFSIARKIRSEE